MSSVRYASTEIADRVLVVRAQHGDLGAFDVLLQRYAKKVRAIVNRFVREPADAEDLTQETFLKAFAGLSKFRGESQFYSWLYRIAFNVGISFHRSKARLECTNKELLDGIDLTDPEGVAISEESSRKLNETIALMLPEMRDALLLNTFRGHDYRTVSMLLRCPLGTVRSRISRARGELAMALQT